MQSRNPGLFYGFIIVAIVSLIIGIYYAIPGVYHVLVSGKNPPMQSQPSHVVLFIAITVICVLAALVTRPKPVR